MPAAGGTLVKLLATVAALMTVTAGVPRVQCVCPDGRVKFFCAGSPASGCCDPSVPNSGEIKDQCCPAADATLPCCGRANEGEVAGPVGDPQTPAIGTCGCQRTIVVDALAVAAKAKYAGDDSRVKTAGFVAWKLPPVASQQAARSAWVERRFVLPPPDLVVVLCHFTC